MPTSSAIARLTRVSLVAVPLLTMSALTVGVFLPTVKDPESKLYSSSVGYPALKRKLNQRIKIQVATVQAKTLDESIAAPGESVALQEIDLTSLVTGVVQSINIVEGQRVNEGFPLMQLDQEPFQNAIEIAQNELNAAEISLETLSQVKSARLIELTTGIESAQAKVEAVQTRIDEFSSLIERGAFSRVELSQEEELLATRRQELVTAQQQLATAKIGMVEEEKIALLNLESSQFRLQEAIRDLENTVIYAPIDGLINQINIERGEMAISGEITLVKLSQNIVFEASIDQARLNTVQVGDDAQIRLVAYPGQIFQGTVIRLNPTVQTGISDSSKTGINQQYTYSVWLQASGLDLTPGLQGYAEFGESDSSMVIPESAVTHLSGGEGMVMVVEDGKTVVKRVALGRAINTEREVISGLSEGQQIVLHPRALQPNDQVKVVSSRQIP